MQRYNNNKRPVRKRPIRDRTVTTLTGNDDEHNQEVLLSGPSAAGAAADKINNNKPSGFNDDHPSVFIDSNPVKPVVASFENLQYSAMPSPSTFGFGYNSFVASVVLIVDYYNQPLPPEKSDLEILENLKERIKKGQHEFFRATPMPELLAGLYLGPSGGSAQDLDAVQEKGSVAVAAAASTNGDGNVGNNKTSFSISTMTSPLAISSENSPSKITSMSTSHQEINGPKSSNENGSKSATSIPPNMTDSSSHGLNNSTGLPAKPPLTNAHGTSMNGSFPKDERSSSSFGREIYPPPPPSRTRASSSSGASSLPHSHSVPAPENTHVTNKYYDARDIRDTRERDRDNYNNNRDKDHDSRRSSSVSVSGAEYASVRYGPIRDIRDIRDNKDGNTSIRRDGRRPSTAFHYDSASYREEDYLPPDDYHRLSGPPSTPQALPNDRYSRPPPAINERHRLDDRYPERVPLPLSSTPSSSIPTSSAYGPSFRPDERERHRYDTHNNTNYPANHNHHVPHAGNTPPTRPNHVHNSTHVLASRYNENRPQIGESPVAAATAAEREQRERAAAEREQREKLERERDRERMGTTRDTTRDFRERDMRPPPPPPSQVHQAAPAKLEERIASRAPTLQERLSQPTVGEGSRMLSLEERLSSHPNNGTGTNPAAGPPASPASSKSDPVAAVPPDSASSAASTTTIGTAERAVPASASGGGPNSVATGGPPNSRSFSATAARDETGAVRGRYSSPTPSERDRERERSRTYPSPPPYDRDRDHRRVSSGGGGNISGREYIYDERDRLRDRRREWPPSADEQYFRSSSGTPVGASRPAPSTYASPPPPGTSDRYERDHRNGLRAPWEQRDHERRISAPGVSAAATTSSPRSEVPSRGGTGIPIPIPIPIPVSADERDRDRDRSYRSSDSRYPPPSSSVTGTPSPYTHGRVRPRSPSPNTRGPPVKRSRDDLYPSSSSAAAYSSPSGYGGSPPPNSNRTSRRMSDYPPPPVNMSMDEYARPLPIQSMPLSQLSREIRDPRDAYYDKYDKYDSRPPPSSGSASAYPPQPSIPANYDRPRSPPPPRSTAYPAGYRDPRDVRDSRDVSDMRDPRDIVRDARDPRDIRDVRDVRDVRDMRDIRDPRDMRDVRDVRDMRYPRDDPRRFSMPPPPLPR
ncbi:hypothetical protein EV368DRAFT_87663 [Lentinula lateritia]|nr:hypothetical protein EV368DRAFT_87663 [Lentinula lateritia]